MARARRGDSTVVVILNVGPTFSWPVWSKLYVRGMGQSQPHGGGGGGGCGDDSRTKRSTEPSGALWERQSVFLRTCMWMMNTAYDQRWCMSMHAARIVGARLFMCAEDTSERISESTKLTAQSVDKNAYAWTMA